MATGTKQAPATPGVFELDDEYTNAFNASAARGRAAEPSPYLDAIKEAAKTGAVKGVQVVGKNDDEKEKHARKIENDLRKGAKQASAELPNATVQLTVKRRMNHPKLPPFVGFEARVVPDKTE